MSETNKHLKSLQNEITELKKFTVNNIGGGGGFHSMDKLSGKSDQAPGLLGMLGANGGGVSLSKENVCVNCTRKLLISSLKSRRTTISEKERH
jgi:hypothetical protein